MVSLCRNSASGRVRWIVIVRARASVSIPRERSQRAAAHAPPGADDAGVIRREAPPRVDGRRKRSIEARKSSGRTGRPSEYRSPGRSVNT